MSRIALVCGMFLTSVVASAQAQDGDPFDTIDKSADQPAGADNPDGEKPTTEEEVDPTLFEGENPGEEENPDDPRIDLTPEAEKKKKKVRVRPRGYPQEVLYRPLTLPGGMGQASLDYRLAIAPTGNGIIGVHYGITPRIQVGLRYGVGTFHSDGYEVGKTLAIDVEYTIFNWLAAQLSVPMLVDPYTAAVTLGAPMKFTFRDKLRFDLGRDLITVRTHREYYPRIGDALTTAGQVALDATNTNVDAGEFRFVGGVTYQHDIKLAAELRFGITLPDFTLESDAPYLFEVGGTYAHSQNIDLGGYLGFTDLTNAGDSFGLQLFARFRLGG